MVHQSARCIIEQVEGAVRDKSEWDGKSEREDRRRGREFLLIGSRMPCRQAEVHTSVPESGPAVKFSNLRFNIVTLIDSAFALASSPLTRPYDYRRVFVAKILCNLHVKKKRFIIPPFTDLGYTQCCCFSQPPTRPTNPHSASTFLLQSPNMALGLKWWKWYSVCDFCIASPVLDSNAA